MENRNIIIILVVIIAILAIVAGFMFLQTNHAKEPTKVKQAIKLYMKAKT